MMKKYIRRTLIFLLVAFSALPVLPQSQDFETHMVAMRDSVRLATHVFRPAGPSHGAVLIRTSEKQERYTNVARRFVRAGYAVAIQNTRGRYGSEGVDSLFFDDGWGKRQDGYDTVEWLAKQPWSAGKVACFGVGIDGFLAYQVVSSAPPGLTTAYVVSAPYDFYQDALFPAGAFRKEFADVWFREHSGTALTTLFEDYARLSRFWLPLLNSRRASEVRVPVAHVTGWYDAFFNGAWRAFSINRRKARGLGKKYQKLIIGPWAGGLDAIGKRKQGELTFPDDAVFDVLADATRWFDQWLKQEDTGILYETPVRYYLMSSAGESFAPGNEWREAGEWPPDAKNVRFYLSMNGMLQRDKKDKNDTAEGYRYNPENPVPTVGGATVYYQPGPRDQQEVEKREDVLLFTTEPLSFPMTVAGRIRLKLYASSNMLDTDFTAKLTDVYPDGRSMLVADGIVRARYRKSLQDEKRLSPNRVTVFEIDLGHTAIVFNEGHRIRLAISSSNSPRFEANPNTPTPFHQNTHMFTAVNSIYYGGKKASYLYLPIVPSADE